MQRSTSAAAPRAALAALTRPQDEDFDRNLLIDDSNDDIAEIVTFLREHSPRGLEVLS